ncbi:SusC/RagA family TonB-linked outer membrane protein [Sphingobacterium sp. SGR-19]|uniref:SusC/RagA family TonB-linked outer membrane protein n=1 Tax=Sphingobacterium sp. SGR-19 TaxID=2710886 RepID=UPI0013EA5A66|nr:TonB-dependent receptor [Sphingobacterium sp. SGR-19]NGM66680.1 TonB-dependent receptor [Sphingobacterium sp. SGR-19]
MREPCIIISLFIYLFVFGVDCYAIDAKPINPNVYALNQTTYIGIVKDKSANPIAGASVSVRNSAVRTQTDSRGQFSIQASQGDVVEISYLGYTQANITLTQQTSLDIILEDAVNTELDEVIVIGYGTTTRRRVVGAVDNVNSDIIENRPVSNLTQALQGTMPSVNIQQRSMNPNDNTMNFNIRGIGTMNNNSPLIVIDGLVSDGASLDRLNPNDIESASVLKDAGTAAIYGSRSANGVLLVTTKKGKKNQKPVLRVSTQTGIQTPKVLFRPVEGYQNATLRNLSLTNVGAQPQFTPEQIRDLYDHRAEEEWNYDVILQDGLQQNYNITMSGGSENTTYLFSGGFYDQESNFVGDFGIQRYNLRANVTSDINDRIKISSILNYARNNNKASTASNAIINSSRVPSYYYYRMQADNGKYLVNNALTDQNPLAELRDGGSIDSDNDYFNVNLGLDVKIIDGLKLRGVFGADLFSNHRYTRRLQIPLYSSPDATTPLVFVNAERNTEDYNEKTYLLNYQLLLDYDKTFDKHQVTGLFGASNESYTRRANEIMLRFTDPILGVPVTETEILPGSYVSPQQTTETSLNSLFGRLGYSFDQKYFIEGSFRYDGSSKFLKENRWSFFPSVSLGWRLSDELFMENYRDKIGDVKIRGTYGHLGNQNIDNYQYLTIYTAINNSYGFNNTSVSGAGFRYGNETISWETTKSFNIGADLTFFNQRLNASLDYFNNKTIDILTPPIIPSVFGTNLGYLNVGEMVNRGWEISVNYGFETGNFRHRVGGNIGDTFNKVTQYPNDELISSADNVTNLIRVGVPFRSYYGYKTDGYFQSIQEIETAALPVGMTAEDLKPGDVRYVDRNQDGVVDARDRYVLGSGFPRYAFGFTYDVSYKGFDFNMLIQGAAKRDMMVRGELVEPFHANYSFAMYQHQLDYWTPTNTSATWPRLTAAGAPSTANNYGRDSDIYMFDGAYARLKNIQLGYTIPRAYSEKIGIASMRLFVNGQNLLTLSKNSWIDPESSEFDSNMSGSANSARNYPTLKYYGFGLDIQF